MGIYQTGQRAFNLRAGVKNADARKPLIPSQQSKPVVASPKKTGRKSLKDFKAQQAAEIDELLRSHGVKK